MLRAQYQERGNRSRAESDRSAMELCSLFRGAALHCQATAPTWTDAIALALMGAHSKEAPMDEINKPFLDLSTERIWPTPEVSQVFGDSIVRITDERVARLLLLLYELDESIAGLEELPKSELSELISSAILACGFVDPIEERYAISAVLEAIEVHDSMPERS
jgi:hypothetical protein